MIRRLFARLRRRLHICTPPTPPSPWTQVQAVRNRTWRCLECYRTWRLRWVTHLDFSPDVRMVIDIGDWEWVPIDEGKED